MNNFIPHEKTITILWWLDCRRLKSGAFSDHVKGGKPVPNVIEFYSEHLSKDADNE